MRDAYYLAAFGQPAITGEEERKGEPPPADYTTPPDLWGDPPCASPMGCPPYVPPPPPYTPPPYTPPPTYTQPPPSGDGWGWPPITPAIRRDLLPPPGGPGPPGALTTAEITAIYRDVVGWDATPSDVAMHQTSGATEASLRAALMQWCGQQAPDTCTGPAWLSGAEGDGATGVGVTGWIVANPYLAAGGAALVAWLLLRRGGKRP